MDFTRYSAEDFLLDESFQAYVSGHETEPFWAEWLREHPQQRAAADEARALLLGLRPARPYPVPGQLKYQELARLRQGLPAPARRLPWLRRQRRRVALALGTAALAALGWGHWGLPATPGSEPVRFAAAPGQRRTLALPDGSVVTLNGGATLTTAAGWTAETPREIWLTGEAYFRVAHRAAPAVTAIATAPANVKFVVHAGNLAISVLGTQFDVNSRAGSTNVVLTSGQVVVSRLAGPTPENLLMQPGDLVETSAARPGLVRRHVRPALYAAWTQGQFQFQQTPVRDIVQLLRDAYGLRVQLTDSALLRQTITGTLPANNPALLLPALATSLGVRVTRHGNLVRFSAPAR